MRKYMMLVAMLLMAATQMNAQQSLNKEQEQAKQAQQKAYKKALNEKPCKAAKKQAKELQKEGWKVNAGSLELAQQCNYGMLLEMESITDDEGNEAKRYVQHTGQSIAGSYNAAFAAARSYAQMEVASALESKLAAINEIKTDNAQDSRNSATTVDKIHQRAKAITEACLTNAISVLTAYRETQSGYEVQVRYAYDKKLIQAKMKQKLQEELELEGDALKGVTDEVSKDSYWE